MKRMTYGLGLWAVFAALLLAGSAAAGWAEQAGKSPVKVFILAGQSNMEGQGCIDFSERRTEGYKRRGMSEEVIAEKTKGALDHLAKDSAKADRYGHIADKDGRWVARDDVWVYYERGRGGLKKGPLTVGFGANDEKIGPEFQFGHLMGDALDNQVLLIKTAWGGKSLGLNFRPPSAGKIPYELNPNLQKKIDSKEVVVGQYYRDMIAKVREVLKNLKQHFPDYDGRGYEIVGFCWHQGWNDGCDEQFSQEYAKNIVHFIRDVRGDLGVKDMPFVIANSGFGGRKTHRGVVGRLQEQVQPAQAGAAKSLKRVACMDTRDFYRPPEISPGTGDIEHWYSNAESYFLIGDAMGQAMKKLLKR